MNIPLVDLVRQYEAIRDEVNERIAQVLESGVFILGENVRSFEKEFASYCGVKYAVGVASGTDALVLSLRALHVRRGDEVISVPNTFISTIDAITYNQAFPMFVDIDPQTYCIDTQKVKKRISRRTKAVIPVHLYGHPADMNPLRELADKQGLYIIEDACQAHGAEYAGKRVGSFGICACFSFYPSKNLGAYGDGGMIVTNDENTAETIRTLRDYGQKEKYHHTILGVNSRLDEIQAAVLRVKLKYLDQWIKRRRENARAYDKGLREVPEILTPIEKDGAKHVYYVYAIRAEERDELREFLSKRGISTGVHYPIPVHLQEAYRELGYEGGEFPIAEMCCRTTLSLPMFPELTEEEISYVSAAVREFYRTT